MKIDIDHYIGIPYKLGGRTTAGIDCYGLVKLVYERERGIVLPDWSVDETIDWDEDRGMWVEMHTPTELCIVRTRRSGNMPDHFGIVTQGGILSAANPSSSFVSMETYMKHHPDSTFGVYA